MTLVPSNLGEFFTFIGSASAIGFVLSLIAEQSRWFQSRNKQGKMATLLFIAMVMSLLSYSLVRFVPAGVVEQAQPYYQTIYSAVVIVLASQVWHRLVNKQAEPPALSTSPTQGQDKTPASG